MKRKYRKAVCLTLNGIIGVILSPLLLIAYIGKWSERLFDFAMRTCNALCEHDTAPD